MSAEEFGDILKKLLEKLHSISLASKFCTNCTLNINFKDNKSEYYFGGKESRSRNEHSVRAVIADRCDNGHDDDNDDTLETELGAQVDANAGSNGNSMASGNERKEAKTESYVPMKPKSVPVMSTLGTTHYPNTGGEEWKDVVVPTIDSTPGAGTGTEQVQVTDEKTRDEPNGSMSFYFQRKPPQLNSCELPFTFNENLLN